MSIGRLILREISHRKLAFLLGIAAVTVAVGTLVGAQALLQGDALETARLLEAKQAEVEQAVAARQEQVAKAGADLEDAMRRHMKELGFNLLILPEGQDLSELHLSGGLSATMPESYVDKLAASNIVTVNHLLPSVTRRITWPEENRDVILVGTRGEVPFMHRGMKKPLLEAVAPGKIVVGYDIHQSLGLSEGDKLMLMGRDFEVSKLHPQRGSEDDVTVWIDLAQAQEMLGMQNLIHAILALECGCTGDRISTIRNDVGAILPGTQVIERYSAALARSEARAKAKETAESTLAAEIAAGKETLKREQQSRQQQEERRAAIAALIVPLVMAASIALIAILAYVNARQRQPEVGILRAIGLTGRQIMTAFLGKALLIGMIGGVLGCVLGLAVVGSLPDALSASAEVNRQLWAAVVSSRSMILTLLLAPLLATFLSGLASWLPALLAARQDPALILQGE